MDNPAIHRIKFVSMGYRVIEKASLILEDQWIQIQGTAPAIYRWQEPYGSL